MLRHRVRYERYCNVSMKPIDEARKALRQAEESVLEQKVKRGLLYLHSINAKTKMAQHKALQGKGMLQGISYGVFCKRYDELLAANIPDNEAEAALLQYRKDGLTRAYRQVEAERDRVTEGHLWTYDPVRRAL